MKIQIEVKRDDKFWLVRVPEVDRWTQARSLAEVEPMAVDLVALMADIEPGDVEVVATTITLPEPVRAHLAEAELLRKQAAEANHAAALAARAAARELKAGGLTVRDIGKAMHVSYQRAHQLVSD